MGRGTSLARSAAGLTTAVGLVMLLTAIIVVPASPVLAATPTLDVTTYCADNDDHMVDWTTSSSNPNPGGGTADGAVTITQSIDYQDVITETTVVGEYNEANGYEISGTFKGLDHNFVPGLPPAYIQVTVEVDQFDDGTGVGSIVMSSWIRIDMCKDSTTTSGATTTTAAITLSASVTAVCEVVNGVDTYPIDVLVSGDEGATGTVTINGVDYPYTIGASLQEVISADGVAGDNTIEVVDDAFGSILSEVINLPDCGPDDTTTTTDPDDTTTTTDPDDTTTTTDPDDTTTTTDPDDTTTTTDPDDTTTTTDPDDTTTTTDPDDTTTTTDPDGSTTTSDPDGSTTTSDGSDDSTTTSESSSNTGTPPVSVLPTEIDQTELPQTGLDNGPLAAIGLTMLFGGAALLLLVRRNRGVTEA